MGYRIFQPLRQVKGVLFDMDGVILDSEKLYTRFWLEASRAVGFPMTLAQVKGMRALNHTVAAERLRGYFGTEVDYGAMKAKRIELMDAYVAREGIQAKPGIQELLELLKANAIPVAIATASPIQRVEQYLEPLGLFREFDAICTAYDVPRGKPEPDIYLQAARMIGLEAGDCLAIEDSAAGIESAFRAGCMVTMVPDQDPPAQDTLPRLTLLADSLLDVAQALTREGKMPAED